MSLLEEELRTLLNKHSRENNSDTPDFILAKYLITCLENYEWAVNVARQWQVDNPIRSEFDPDWKWRP